MSSLFASLPPHSFRAAGERQIWRELFGDLIRAAREKRTLSLEEVARASGMSTSEWEKVEAGAVPCTRQQLRALAAGLGLEWEDMVCLAILCRQAWEG